LRATAATSRKSEVAAMPRASSEPAQPVAPARHTSIVMPVALPQLAAARTLGPHDGRPRRTRRDNPSTRLACDLARDVK
jgi:hypothetical protein